MSSTQEERTNMRVAEGAESELLTEAEIDMLIQMIDVTVEVEEEEAASAAEILLDADAVLDFDHLLDLCGEDETIRGGDDDVLVNRCMGCARDMGDTNPRQLCGKIVCLLAKEEEEELLEVVTNTQSEAMEEELISTSARAMEDDNMVTIDDILEASNIQLMVEVGPTIEIPMPEDQTDFDIEYDAAFTSLVDWGQPTHEEMIELLEGVSF